MPADIKGSNPLPEKKDAVENEKGDKRHAGEEKAQDQQTRHPGGDHHEGRGGHRRRTGGNPDGAND